MDKYQIVIRPLITEQGTHQAQTLNAYPFEVHPKAKKPEIKQAIEKIYNVKVDRISSLIVKGKTKRLRWNQPGKTTPWKKAIVTLKKGFEIKFT